MLILTETKKTVGFISFNNGLKRNILSRETCAEITAALEEFEKKDIRAVIIRSSVKSGTWSAGHDLKEISPSRNPFNYYAPLEILLRKIQTYKGAVLAMIHGGVWGGAVDLALTCDISVGDETAFFAITPAKIGLPYNAAGLTHFCGRISTNIIKEMFFTGMPVKADRAYNFGLLNHLVDEEKLPSFTEELACGIARMAPLTVRAVKEQLRILNNKMMSADEAERLQQIREQVMNSGDLQEGLRAFGEKRKPEFEGK